MPTSEPTILADASAVDAMVQSLADAIAMRMAKDADQPNKGLWAVVGIKRGGDVIADRIAEKLAQRGLGDRLDGRVGRLDITLYRDDLSEIGQQPIVRTTEIDFDLDGLSLVLIDDVIMTGRSTRAALQCLMDLGRPRRVWLASLVDRGGRELPIQPDDVGMTLGDDRPGHVEVRIGEPDHNDAVLLMEPAQ